MSKVRDSGIVTDPIDIQFEVEESAGDRSDIEIEAEESEVDSSDSRSEPTTLKACEMSDPNDRISAPVFNRQKRFETYMIEVDAWCLLCEKRKGKGLALAYSLPDDDPSDIKDKLLDSISLTDLAGEKGVDKFKEFMTANLGKDLTLTYEYYSQFDKFKRTKG